MLTVESLGLDAGGGGGGGDGLERRESDECCSYRCLDEVMLGGGGAV